MHGKAGVRSRHDLMCGETSIGAFLVSTMEKTNHYAEGSAPKCAPALGIGVSWE